MNRAQQIIRMFEDNAASAERDAPTMTDLGIKVVKDVDTVAKAELRKLNPALKWEWAGHQPSEQQRKSDNLEWKLAVNSHTHGDELTAQVKDWAETTLQAAIDANFDQTTYLVGVDIEDSTFPKPEDDERGDLRLVSVQIRLDGLKANGLTE